MGKIECSVRLYSSPCSRPLYKIEMKLVQESSYTKNVKQYSVYKPEAYPRKLGLVIGSPLPTGAMHPFDLFTNSGINWNCGPYYYYPYNREMQLVVDIDFIA